MLIIRKQQLEVMIQHQFYEKIDQFVSDNSLRDDWKVWMHNTKHVRQIWDRAWPHSRKLTEHDCALCLVLLAIYAFEGVIDKYSSNLFSEVSSREVVLKQYIADQGYLYFTAFDYPVGDIEEESDNV